MAMDERKQRILQAIVTLYTEDGEPIGSNLLSRHIDMALSSATLRNEMAALTKLGLLEQPHTSAGRVPSTAGYRYYIDNIIDLQANLSSEDAALIDRLFDSFDFDPEKLAQETAKSLSDLTGYAVVTTTPKAEDMRIAHYEVMQVGRFTVAVLAVTSAGGVRTRVAKLDAEVTAKEIALLLLQLNRYLCFVSAADVTPALIQELLDEMGENGISLYPAVSAAVTLLREAGKPNVYLEGQQYLFQYKELEQSMATILELFGNTEAIQSLISPVTDRTTVLLGDDLPRYSMPGITIATKRYWAGSGLTGAIGLIGPTRMNYNEIIPKLEYFSQKLSHLITSGGKKER
ncbi:MAG: heat-inducible transcriptional repressor HrcA [Oscillospiraceae bacterium]|nr:heat-inducible transcriptional repressor HrcA [Oscillospiraceae bacterium]